MKALTICQPYATMIVRGEKVIENRTWFTNHRGSIYIHAGKSRSWLTDTHVSGNMPFGAVVAIADLYDCVKLENLPAHLVGDRNANGPYCWLLRNVTPIGPWPYRGAQGLFDIDDLDEVANRELGIPSTAQRVSKDDNG
jgi:hypothetical protein